MKWKWKTAAYAVSFLLGMIASWLAVQFHIEWWKGAIALYLLCTIALGILICTEGKPHG